MKTKGLINLLQVKRVLCANVIAALFWLVTSVSAQSGSEAFNAANKLYELQNYSAAADQYEKLIQASNVSAAIYYNLGTASFKAGQIGRAIAAFRNAQVLAPRDPDVQANLQFARKEANSRVTESPWQQWVHRFTLNEWAVAAAAALWIFFGFLSIGQWRPAFRKTYRVWSAVCGVVGLFLGVCLAFATYDRLYTRGAVVAVPEAVIRRGPFDESQSYFTLRDGAELSVIDKKEKWLQVADSSHRIGWLPESQVVVLNWGP
jgi:tetratricopeptide (TPR) repeat protein